MVELLEQIKDFAATAAVLLVSIPLLLLARDLVTDWAKKLVYLSIIVAIWIVLVEPYAEDIKTIVICILTVMPYSMVTEQTALFIQDTFIMLVTLKIFKWLFTVKGPHESSQSKSK